MQSDAHLDGQRRNDVIALKVTSMKEFTKQLFLQDTFDGFLLTEAIFTTSCVFTIDGGLNRDYYEEAELAEIGDRQYSTWKELRPLCFQLIKGNKLPLSFRITLRMKQSNVELILERNELTGQFDVDSLQLNILYKNGTMTCTTGIALRQFTMDKSLDQVWDTMVRKFFQKHQIEYSES